LKRLSGRHSELGRDLPREQQVLNQKNRYTALYPLATWRDGVSAQSEQQIVERLLLKPKNFGGGTSCDGAQKYPPSLGYQNYHQSVRYRNIY